MATATDPTQTTPASGQGLINAPSNTPQLTPPATPPDLSTPASSPSYPAASATASPANATGYTANPYTVTGDQTVQGQLDKIIAQDSPLMQQARTRAAQDMNARGLINSSIGVGAGENAVIAQALPIAQQDASINNQAMTNTVNAENTASQFKAGAENTANLQNSQLMTAVAQGNQQAINTAFQTTVNNLTQLTNTQLNNQEQTALGNLDAASKQAIAVLGSQNQNLLQTNANAANMFQETVKNIAAIAVDATLSPDAKNAAVQTQINLLNQGLQTTAGIASTVPAAISNLNLSQYFQVDTSGNPTVTPTAQMPVQTGAPGAASLFA